MAYMFWLISEKFAQFFQNITSNWRDLVAPRSNSSGEKKTALFKLDITRVSELLMDVIVGETSHNTEQAVHMLSQVSDSRLWGSFLNELLDIMW